MFCDTEQMFAFSTTNALGCIFLFSSPLYAFSSKIKIPASIFYIDNDAGLVLFRLEGKLGVINCAGAGVESQEAAKGKGN